MPFTTKHLSKLWHLILRGEGIIFDALLGIVGAFIGGWLFQRLGHAGVNGLSLHSILVATVSAITLFCWWCIHHQAHTGKF